MPPEGYTTLTVPDELAERVDDYAPRQSTTATIRHLLDADDADDGVGDVTLEATEYKKIAEEVADQLAEGRR